MQRRSAALVLHVDVGAPLEQRLHRHPVTGRRRHVQLIVQRVAPAQSPMPRPLVQFPNIKGKCEVNTGVHAGSAAPCRALAEDSAAAGVRCVNQHCSPGRLNDWYRRCSTVCEHLHWRAVRRRCRCVVCIAHWAYCRCGSADAQGLDAIVPHAPPWAQQPQSSGVE